MNIKELKLLIEIAENLDITDEVYFAAGGDMGVQYSSIHATIEQTEEIGKVALVFSQRW